MKKQCPHHDPRVDCRNSCGCNHMVGQLSEEKKLCGCEADEWGIEHTIEAHSPQLPAPQGCREE